jgi:hypothetical protein
MKRPSSLVTLFFVALLATTDAFSQSKDDVPLTFTRLDLTDGRKLKNVVVKSYDAKSGKLLIIADGKATTIAIALVPPPFNEQLKSAPRSGETVTTIATPRVVANAADQYYMDTAVPPAPPPSKTTPSSSHSSVRPKKTPSAPTVVYVPAPTSPAPVAQQQPAHPALAAAGLKEHQDAAKARAQKYYQYEFPLGSNSVTVTAQDIELSVPKLWSNWDPPRYTMEGKIYINYYDSKGGSFQRATSTFEITTEQRPGEEVKVIDFTRKS